MVLRSVEDGEKRVDKEFIWIVENATDLQRKYEDKWIAVVGGKVVGVGKDAKEAYEAAKKISPKEPLLEYVPKREVLIL